MTDLKFKPGDHVMVPMVVEKVLDDERLYRVHLRDQVKACGFYTPEATLASATLIERPLAVGDAVVWGNSGHSYSISSIDGELAVVRYFGWAWLVPLSELRRAEERG